MKTARIGFLALLGLTGALLAADVNPLVKEIFTADPAGRVFNNKVYVYTSHDSQDARGFDSMVDWHLLSSSDMVTWKDHGAIMSLKDFPWATKFAWAPDCIEVNKKFYLYLPMDRTKIGVAVSDSPEGPFKDAIGGPLIDNKTMPFAGEEPIDPALFIDDDKQAYMAFGCRKARIVKLDASMTKLDGEIQEVKLLDPEGKPIPIAPVDVQPQLPMGYGEAPYMFKRDGKYYFVYSNGWAAQSTIVYAMGDKPMGPFTYVGKVMEHVPGTTQHASIINYHEKWYIFYHTNELSRGNSSRRAICVDELTFAPDGKIKTVTATKKGPEPVTGP